MAGGAGDAVTGESAVAGVAGLRVVGWPGNGVDLRAGESVALIVQRAVDRLLARSGDAVAAEAHRLHLTGVRGVEGPRLAGELRVEDRVAAGEPHRRGPP